MKYEIIGQVIRGIGYGHKIGYPTMNLDRRHFGRLENKPKRGIYSGSAIINKKKYRAGIIIGPNDKTGLPKIEAHLLEYKGNAYGKKVILKLEKYLRVFKNFNEEEEELIIQIKKDLIQCK